MAGACCAPILSSRLGFVRATEIAATIGQGFAFLLGFLGLFYNPILIFIAIFVYLAAASEAHMVALRAVSRGVPAMSATMTRIATLKPDAHIDEAVQVLLQTSQGEFPVVDEERQAGRPSQPRRHHSRPEGTRPRRPRGGGHEEERRGDRPPLSARRGAARVAGEIRTHHRGSGAGRQAGRADLDRDRRRIDAGQPSHAAGLPARTKERLIGSSIGGYVDLDLASRKFAGPFFFRSDRASLIREPETPKGCRFIHRTTSKDRDSEMPKPSRRKRENDEAKKKLCAFHVSPLSKSDRPVPVFD